jgi:hypothetical protein
MFSEPRIINLRTGAYLTVENGVAVSKTQRDEKLQQKFDLVYVDFEFDPSSYMQEQYF